MFWVIRWADGDVDRAAVVEAETRGAAEYSALKRNIPVVFVGEADAADVREARQAKMLWTHTRAPRYTCLGRPVGRFQLASFMLTGIAVALVNLHRAFPTSCVTETVRHWVA